MDDAELDDLIATTARVGDADVAAWDLAGPETALREEITTMPTVHAPAGPPAPAAADVSATPVAQGPSERTDPSPPDVGRIGPRRGRRLALAGAAAAVAAIVTVTVTAGGADPIAAGTVEAALDRSSAALERSGRLELQYRLAFEDGYVAEATEHWSFSGDEVLATIPGPDGAETGVHSSTGQLTIHPADRELIARLDRAGGVPPGGGEPGAGEPGDGQPAAYRLDPRTLLEELRASGTFEEVGTEDVDGVPSRRLRATDPGAAPSFPILYNDAGGEVTSLELWVDGESLVRRLDMTTERDGYVETLSLAFADLGDPVAIGPPAGDPPGPAGEGPQGPQDDAPQGPAGPGVAAGD